jgi:photosystem II stability/assembly factor-like uncharacterized protein
MKYLYLLIISFFHFYSQLNSQPLSFDPRGMGGGGALFFPSINPSNDNEFYVACDLSAMFHSMDYGKSYTQIDFTQLQAFSNSTYEFTNDPNIAYSNFNDGNEGYPVKTTDGGKTWNRINAYNSANYGMANSINVNYDNPQQLLINSYGDILFSNNGGNSFNLVKHTVNNGAGLIMAGVMWDANFIYIGTNEGLVYSNNSGNSFLVMPTTGMTTGQTIWSFAGAKESGTTRFVCIAANNSDTYNGIMPWEYDHYAKAVYVMDNVSGNWMNRSTGINFNNDFIMYAGMAENNINVIYLGGNDAALGAPLVMKTTNGGMNWNKVFNTTNNANIVTAWEGYQGDKNWSWSENCFGITVAPHNPNKVMFPTFSNVQLSDDGGQTWRQAYVNAADEHPAGISTPKNKSYHSIGLENTTCWQIFWQDANTMMGCYSDIGGIRSIDAGMSWGYQYTGFSVNSLYRMVKSPNGTMYGACSNIHDMYQSTRLADAQLDANDGNGKIVFSSDNGASWSNLHVFNHPVFWIATDPANPNTMYASVIHFGGTQGSQQGGIYRCNDLNKGAASSWSKLSNPPRTEGHPASIEVLKNGKVVCTFSGRRNSSGTFTASSGVFIYDPVLNTWKDVSDKNMQYWTKDIIIDPEDASQNTWYACVWSGWGGAPNGLGGLYRTINGGTNWTRLTGFDRVTSITVNPQNHNQAYLTTETEGLWITENLNAVTPVWKPVRSYPYRQPERVFFNPYNANELWISSFGNGMKVGKLNVTANENITDKSQLKIFPNPSDGKFEIQLPEKIKNNITAEVFDPTGHLLLKDKLIKKSNGNFAFSDSKIFAKGVYVLRIMLDDKNYTAKIIIE